MRRLVVLALLASCAPIAYSQAALNDMQLVEIANRARSFVPRDEFDVAPHLPSVDGRRFNIVLAPLKRGPNNQICEGFPSWGYWPDEGKLQIGAGEYAFISDELRSRTGARLLGSREPGMDSLVFFRSFTCQYQRFPDKIMSNALGAKFTVRSIGNTVVAIARLGNIIEEVGDSKDFRVMGDEARQLSQNSLVRLAGTLKDWGPGKPVVCGTKHVRADVTQREESQLNICIFNGKLDRFEVIDKRTGAVLSSSK